MAAVFKQQAHQLVDQLPDSASWNDLIYQAVLRREIEAGLADSAAGRVTPVDDVLREFGLES
jgi:predicted transcriptional regulator